MSDEFDHRVTGTVNVASASALQVSLLSTVLLFFEYLGVLDGVVPLSRNLTWAMFMVSVSVYVLLDVYDEEIQTALGSFVADRPGPSEDAQRPSLLDAYGQGGTTTLGSSVTEWAGAIRDAVRGRPPLGRGRTPRLATRSGSDGSVTLSFADRVSVRHVSRYLLPTILIGGFVIRLYNVDVLALWIDEAISARAAIGIFEQGAPAIRMLGGEYNPYERGVLHSYLVAASMALLGDGELAVRLPGVLWGTALVGLAYLWGERFGNTTVGVVFAVLVAFHPWQIATSRYTRFYSQFQFLFLCSLYTFFVWLESAEFRVGNLVSDGDRRYLLTFVLVTALAKFTHRYWILIPAITGGYLLMTAVSDGPRLLRWVRRSVDRSRPVYLALSATLMLGSSAVVLQLVPQKVWLLLAGSSWRSADLTGVTETLFDLSGPLFVCSLVVVATTIGERLLRRRGPSSSRHHGIYPVVAAVLVFVALSVALPVIRNAIETRYLSPLAPLMLFFMSIVVSRTAEVASTLAELCSERLGTYRGSYRTVVTLVVVITLVLSVSMASVGFVAEDQYRDDLRFSHKPESKNMRGPSDYVLERYSADDTVYLNLLNTPAFYLGYDRGKVDSIRVMVANDSAWQRWSDDSHAVTTRQELDRSVRRDAENGTVWFVTYRHYWQNRAHQEWVQENTEVVDASWKNSRVRRFEPKNQTASDQRASTVAGGRSRVVRPRSVEDR